MDRGRVLVLGLALLVLTGLLAAGLRTVEFRAGRSISGPLQWGRPRANLQLPYGWLDRLFDFLPWFLLGLLILGLALTLVSREFRRAVAQEIVLRVIAGLALLALFGLGVWLGQLHLSREEPAEIGKLEPPKFWEPKPSASGPTAPLAEGSPAAAGAPWWVGYLAAVALAAPLLWLAMRAVRRFSRPSPLQKGPERELAAAARAAAAELREGLPLEEVVIRRWARMTEILAGRTGGAGGPPAVTPRELARLLAERGIRHEAIIELTKLFEEVRYGGKADLPRRAQAIAALAAIEEAYGRA